MVTCGLNSHLSTCYGILCSQTRRGILPSRIEQNFFFGKNCANQKSMILCSQHRIDRFSGHCSINRSKWYWTLHHDIILTFPKRQMHRDHLFRICQSVKNSGGKASWTPNFGLLTTLLTLSNLEKASNTTGKRAGTIVFDSWLLWWRTDGYTLRSAQSCPWIFCEKCYFSF